MKLKHYAYLILLCVIIFGIYIFATPTMSGADTYYYVNGICGIYPNWPATYDILFNTFVLFMPCNFVAMKLYLMVLFIIVVLTSAKICELYDGENGWIGGIIGATFTFMVYEFFQFENDSLGYTIFFISCYFLMKYHLQRKKRDLIIALIIFGIGGLVWRGILYWTIPFMILAPITAFIFIPMIAYFWNQFTWFLFPNLLIAEQQSWIAVVFWGLTTFFLYGLVKIDKKIVSIIALLCVPALFVVKLYVLPIPFLIILTFLTIKNLKISMSTIIPFLMTFGLMMAVFYGMQSEHQFPTSDDANLVKNMSLLTHKPNNEFGVGYLVEYYGMDASARGSVTDINFSGYVITIRDTNYHGCEVLEESRQLAALKCAN